MRPTPPPPRPSPSGRASPPAPLPGGLASFPGIARRFDIRHDAPGLTVIDDYAHHPSEIDNTIAAARATFPGRRLVGVFQPHLFTRTRDFLDGFATALSKLDHGVLLPIYPAREKPPPGVDAQAVGEKMVGCPVECPRKAGFWMFWRRVIRTCCSSWERGPRPVDSPAIERLSASRTTQNPAETVSKKATPTPRCRPPGAHGG